MVHFKNLFPLLYLLLSRHHSIIKAARVYLLHPDELRDAGNAVALIEDEFERRRESLCGECDCNILSTCRLSDYQYSPG